MSESNITNINIDIKQVESARDRLDKRDPLRAKLSKQLNIAWKEIKKKKNLSTLQLTAEEWVRAFWE